MFKNCVTFLRKRISRIKQYLASNKIEDQFKSEPRKNQFKGLCTKINFMSRGGITLQIVLDDSLESISDQDLYHRGASTLFRPCIRIKNFECRLINGGSLILVQKVFEGGFVMCWHLHADLNFSAFSIEEFFGSKPVNDVKSTKI